MLRVFATLVLCSVATAQVYQLTTETFDVALQEGPLFVKFYAPWCARRPRPRNSPSPGKTHHLRNSAPRSAILRPTRRSPAPQVRPLQAALAGVGRARREGGGGRARRHARRQGRLHGAQGPAAQVRRQVVPDAALPRARRHDEEAHGRPRRVEPRRLCARRLAARQRLRPELRAASRRAQVGLPAAEREPGAARDAAARARVRRRRRRVLPHARLGRRRRRARAVGGGGGEGGGRREGGGGGGAKGEKAE